MTKSILIIKTIIKTPKNKVLKPINKLVSARKSIVKKYKYNIGTSTITSPKPTQKNIKVKPINNIHKDKVKFSTSNTSPAKIMIKKTKNDKLNHIDIKAIKENVIKKS